MAKLYLGQQPSCRRILKLQNLIKFATKMKTTIDQNFFKKHKKFPDSSILVPNSGSSHQYYVCWNTLYKQLISNNFVFIVYQGIFLVLFGQPTSVQTYFGSFLTKHLLCDSNLVFKLLKAMSPSTLKVWNKKVPEIVIFSGPTVCSHMTPVGSREESWF